MGQRSSSAAVKPSSSTKDNPKAAPDCTEVKVNKFSHEWTIKDIRDSPAILHSRTFSEPDDDKLKWRMELYPYGRDNKLQHISLFLRLLSGIQVSAKFKLILTDAERKIIKGSDWGWTDVIARGILLCSLPAGDPTVRCEVVVLGQCGDDQFNVPGSSLSSDLAQVLHSQKVADCVIEAEGQEIRAHKDVLSARSPVFAAMFEHETQERRTGRVLVADVEFPVMEELVHFIYTDDAPNLSAISERLIVAADKYQLQRLKVMCEANLWKNLNLGNVCETLVLADLHSATQLKDKTIKFINSNANQVTQTHGWEKMNLEQPHLLMEIFKAKGN